jgi:hypothetical protein
MKRTFSLLGYCFVSSAMVFSVVAKAASTTLVVSAPNPAALAAALRISNTITGGAMPVTDPLFAQIANLTASGDYFGAANVAATSPYFAGYLARRLALQMQNAAYDANASMDNDATAFIIAHLAGVGTGTGSASGSADQKPSISTLWSENATYMVRAGGVQKHVSALTPLELANVNWQTDLVRVAGQTAKSQSGSVVAIPSKHVGGYVTLSDHAGDLSLAQNGAAGGTNLRLIEGIWQVSTGLSLTDVQSVNAPAQAAPRFVPETNPNFFVGQGQAACLSCHGGGMSSLTHGYATVADVFDYDPVKGFTYISAPSVLTMKSLGSDPAKRQAAKVCDLTQANMPACNLDSLGVDPNNGWDVSATWANTGVLETMGWNGAKTGLGLNELGTAIGKANIVYENLAKRIVLEICPLGSFTKRDIEKIGATANPFKTPAGTDDVRTLVAMVASHPSCR